MAAPRRWTDADTATMRERHAAGDSLTSIAKLLGRSGGLVSRKAASEGLSWSTAKVAASNEARRDRLKAVRVAILDDLYGIAGANLTGLKPGADGRLTFRTVVKAQYGEERVLDLDVVPPHDLKAVVQAVGTLLTTAARLEAIDADPGAGAAEVDAWLDHAAGGPLPTTSDGQP